MDLPGFLNSVLNRFETTYAHLRQDERAVATLNLAVASAEHQIRQDAEVEEWGPRLPEWFDGVLANLDSEGEHRGTAPPPWCAGVLYAKTLMSVFRQVVVESAVSSDDLINLPDLLHYVCLAVAVHVNAVFFDSFWFDPHEGHLLDNAFKRFLRWGELQSFLDDQVLVAWEDHRTRLKNALGTEKGGADTSERKAAMRRAVVMPILEAKGWTINRWGTTEAGVGKNCAYEYLKGERDLSEGNRVPLAQALGISTEELPND